MQVIIDKNVSLDVKIHFWKCN